MSEKPRKKTVKSTKEAKTATSEKNKENLDSRRKKLLSDIGELKLVISRAECQLSVTKFREIVGTEKLFEPSSRDVKKIIDVDVLTRSELHSLAGISCKKIGNGFVFNFQCWDRKFGMKNSYWIQLFNDAENWQLGLWVLPMSVDVREIEKKHPIDSPTALRYFLKECKHHIDCYNRRKQQYSDLEIFMTQRNLYNCYVEADSTGFTRITIKLVKEVARSSDESRIIVVDLCYKSNETRPSKMIIDCDDSRELSAEETKKFRLYFKSFKELDLKEAAEKILMSDESQSIWRRSSHDDVIETDDDDANSLYTTAREKRSRNRRKRKNDETSENPSKNDSLSSVEVPSNAEVPVEKKISRSVGRPKKMTNIENTKKTVTRPVGRPKKRKSDDENHQENKKTRKNPEKIVSKGKTKNFPLVDRNENIENNNVKTTNKKKRDVKNLSNDRTNDLTKYFSPLQNVEKRINDDKNVKKNFVKNSKKHLTTSTPLLRRENKASIDVENDISEIVTASTETDEKKQKSPVVNEELAKNASSKSDENNVTNLEPQKLLKELRRVNFRDVELTPKVAKKSSRVARTTTTATRRGRKRGSKKK